MRINNTKMNPYISNQYSQKLTSSGQTNKNEPKYKDKVNISFNDPDRELLKKDAFGVMLDGTVHVLIDYDFTKLPSIEIQDNSISFPTDKPFVLNTYDGELVAMRMFAYGGFETSNDGGLLQLEEGITGNEVTPFERYAIEMSEKFSRESHKQIDKEATLLAYLEFLGSGRKTEAQVKSMYDDFNIDPRKELVKLGIDISKSFTVNGNEFILREWLNKFM